MDVLFKEKNIFYHVLCVLITENEKIFDRSDARLYWSTVLHIFSLYHHYFIAVFAMSLDLYSVNHLEIVILRRYRLGFLTGWNFAFQTCFLTLALAHDVLEWSNKHDCSLGRRIKHWRDVIFTSMVVPYTLFVTTMFWCVYWVDRELVFPRVFDAIVPWWFNHCVHTNITVVLLLETLLQPRRQPTHLKLELALNAAVALGYAVVYYTIFFVTGHWLYKVFGVMTWWQVVLYQLAIWGSNYVFYAIQFPINRFIHGASEEVYQNGTVNEVKQVNGDTPKIANGEPMKIVNGEENGVPKKNGLPNGVEVTPMNTDLQIPPFSTKSWSLKYRTLRSQFENTKL